VTTARLVLRQFRFEAGAVGIAIALVIVGYVSLILAIASLGLESCSSTDLLPACADRIAAADGYLAFASPLQFVFLAVSVLAGLVLGAPLVAREVEYGSAPLAWSLGTSRMRWFVPRLLLVGIGLAVALSVPALLADLLEHVRHVPLLPGDSLVDHQLRGLVIVGRALCAFAVGVFAGAVVGRGLPGFLLALILAGPVLLGLELGLQAWRDGEAEPTETPGSLYVSQAYQDHDGLTMSPAEAAAILPLDDPSFPERFTIVILGIPPWRGAEIVIRELGAYVIVAGVIVALAGGVVDRRRPY
jgi:hypothetical protein